MLAERAIAEHGGVDVLDPTRAARSRARSGSRRALGPRRRDLHSARFQRDRAPRRRDRRVFDKVVVCAGVGTSALAELCRSISRSSPRPLRATFADRGASPELHPCFSGRQRHLGRDGVYAALQPGTSARGRARDHHAGAGWRGRRPDRARRFRAPGSRLPREGAPALDRAARGAPLPGRPAARGEALSPSARRREPLHRRAQTCSPAPALGRPLADAAFGEGLDPRFEPVARLGARPARAESAENVSQSAGSPDS